MYWQIWCIGFFLSKTLAHSWNEQLTVIKDGLFAGNNGYPRGYVSRSSPGFDDGMMTYLLPPPTDPERTRINSLDLLCSSAQEIGNQTQDFPRLQVSPGSYIAIKYLENGHVTLPENQPGKPPGAGTVFVFGTDQPNNAERLMDVLHWTRDGNGGDKRGRLLTAQNFDDGRCYQINSGAISETRQKEFPDPIAGQPGSYHEQWCETDVLIPGDVSEASMYTIYWVWSWPTTPGAPGLPNGKDEYYTTCSDIDIVSSPNLDSIPYPLPQQDPQIAPVSNFAFRSVYQPSPLPTGIR